MKINKLRGQYTTLVDEFVRQARVVGAIVEASDVAPVKDVAGGYPQVLVGGIFYLKEWPSSSTSSKANKKLDILLRSSEVYEPDSLVLVKSTIQVMYFEANTEEANPTLGIHYDYEHKMGAAHPIFHAQLGSTNFTLEELAKVKFDRRILPWKDLVRVRIPTVHINFPSALLTLFADHLPHQAFAGFLGWAKDHSLFSDAKARIDCRDKPLGDNDPFVFQAFRLYK
ncbi:hypothetical protein [Paraburkholderia largidicola]|uniref:Uncharacterized protein n=1 Tax=Paraburkholderia largidicola TaxID=3014751 RepID=A0A7I8C346_9BURK|nr:hypothetical protein [Paraburkholderia sp. PGU16]BCF94941.1 hypothetical protein PPGU16_80080 [Paraburkholderia sp. PGU16]